jgi:hypothetical protein
MKVWYAARLASGKAFAYGFVSHNDVWGADCIAHCLLHTCPAGAGYVDAKAAILWKILKQRPDFSNLGLSDAVGLAVCHNLVESGVDLLVKRTLDHMIGWKVTSSALLRSPDFPLLLIKAYAGDFSGKTGMSYLDTAKLITSAEMEFRKTTILYGQVLMQDEATAISLLSEQLAGLAEVAYGISLDPTLLKPLIEIAIRRAMQPDICGSDFAHAVSATIQFVRHGLQSHGISY